jgi:hypothetical protein
MAGHNPIGRRFRFISVEDSRPGAGAKPRPWYQIVGVVPDLGVESEYQGPTAARMYGATLPKGASPLHIAVHVRGDPQLFAPRLRELALTIDPALRVVNPQALPHVMDAEVEFAALWYHLLVGLAVVALVLSLAGVYSVTAFSVAKRTREIGVRVALGAMPRQIIFTTFKRPFIQIALGIGVGALIMSIFVISDGKPSPQILGRVGIAVVLISCAAWSRVSSDATRARRIQPTEALKDQADCPRAKPGWRRRGTVDAPSFP